MISNRTIGEIDRTNQTSDTSQRKAAIAAGLGLLLMIIPAIFANFVVVQNLLVPGDASATAANILANELQFRLGILSFIIVIILDVVVAWALYVFFKPVNKSLSLLTAWFRLVYSAIFAVALFDLLNALRLVSDADYSALFETDQLHSQVMLSLNAYSDGWTLGLIFFGLHLVLLGYLVFKSGFMPKVLGILVIIAGAGYLIDSFGGLLLPDFGLAIGQFTFIGELLLALWLLIKGLNAKAWAETAPETA